MGRDSSRSRSGFDDTVWSPRSDLPEGLVGVYARESLEWGACLVNSRKPLNREVQESTTGDQRLAGLLRLRRLTAAPSS
jgi:hypothetical protein